MPNRFYRTLGALFSPTERADPSLNLNQWMSFFNYSGSTYPFYVNQSMVGNKEQMPHSFIEYAQSMYRSNGVVFAVEAVRMRLFSEARFQFQQVRNGKPGKLFGTPALQLLETPWKGGTTRSLLARAIQDVDIGGNFYGVLTDVKGTPVSKFGAGPPAQIKRLRPDWTSILLGSPRDFDTDTELPDAVGAIDTEVIAYLYHPENGKGGQPVQTLNVEDVVHWAPTPDPIATFRGMSWLTPIMREVMSDSAATNHKLAYFENNGTVNQAYVFDPSITEKAFKAWIEIFRHEHEGVGNAYKSLFLAGGVTPVSIGSNMQQMDFAKIQGHDETRIASAAGVPPIIAGLSEGLDASTYSNYGQARRALGDDLMRPLWGDFSSAIAVIVPPPPGARLWYDDREIAFLREDKADAANILYVKSEAINKLFMSGYDPDSIVDAIESDDLRLLVHTGLPSVQLQPGQIAPLPTEAPPQALPAPAQGKLPAPAQAKLPAANGNGAKGKAASAQILATVATRRRRD